MIAPLIFAASLFATAALLAPLRAWTLRQSILDRPNERSSHTAPMPRGGGIAIVITVLCGLLAISQAGTRTWQIVAFAGTAAIVAFVSWIDDVRGLPIAARFATHVAAAAAAVIVFGSWRTVLVGVEIRLGLLSVPIAVVWIAGLTNAYNFMDGIDGIAGAQGFVAGLAWAWAGNRVGQPWISATGLLVAGASAGFLLYNWQPARIFMGDTGSAFLGFVFATLTLAASQTDRRAALFGILVVWPFVVDTTVTLLRRLVRREPVWKAHRSHLYQRLTQRGWSHQSVAALYAVLAGLGALAGAAVLR